MIPEIEAHRDEIIAICKEYGLECLEVFGSAATDQFDPDRSDIDFLVVYPEGWDYGPWGERVDDLRRRFEQLLGRDVDMVVLRWVRNPYLRRSIEETRVPIYAR